MSNMRRGDQAVRLTAAIGDAVRRGKSERQRAFALVELLCGDPNQARLGRAYTAGGKLQRRETHMVEHCDR